MRFGKSSLDIYSLICATPIEHALAASILGSSTSKESLTHWQTGSQVKFVPGVKLGGHYCPPLPQSPSAMTYPSPRHSRFCLWLDLLWYLHVAAMISREREDRQELETFTGCTHRSSAFRVVCSSYSSKCFAPEQVSNRAIWSGSACIVIFLVFGGAAALGKGFLLCLGFSSGGKWILLLPAHSSYWDL